MDNNITNITIQRLVMELDEAVVSGDVRRADELADIMYRLQNGNDADAVMPDWFPDIFSDVPNTSAGGHPMKKRSIRKITIIAAAVALIAALSITAVATQFFGLRDLVIQSEISAPPTAAPDASSLNKPSSEPDLTPEPQKQDLIALQGYPDSDEYKASAAWNDFCAGYDTDHTILNQVGNNSNVYTEQYPMYLVYSKEMADTLAEITARYGLKLHTSMTIAENADQLYGLAGTGRFLDAGTGGSNRVLSGYVYNDGTFHYDGMAVLQDGAVVNYQLGSYVKGTFSDTYLNVGDADSYREWTYQTACGVTVSLALGGGKALVIADLPDSFVTVNVLAGAMEDSFSGTNTVDGKTLEAFADTIDFSLLAR